MKTHGENVGPTRRSKRCSRGNRNSRPSACRLRPLLIRHSFLTTANKFGLSIFPLNRASQLGGGHTSPLTAEATDDYSTSSRAHLDLGGSRNSQFSIRGHSRTRLAIRSSDRAMDDSAIRNAVFDVIGCIWQLLAISRKRRNALSYYRKMLTLSLSLTSRHGFS